METSYINIITAIIFILVCTIISLSLFYVHSMKKNLMKNKEIMTEPEYINNIEDSYKQHRGHKVKNIEENDRVQFISKCNNIDQALVNLLGKQLVNLNNEQKNMLTEKRFYIKKIREIVNDLTFNNKKEFEQLNSVLKEIQKDVLTQNKRILELESKVSNGDQMKNELANMLIQRMMNDSSKKTLKRPKLIELLEEDGQDKEDDIKRLEKYIIKTIRKQIDKEMTNYPVKSQQMNPIGNIELERKVELMDLVNHKLRSMENLYKNLHSTNKKQIITVIKEPVKKAIQPYISINADDIDLQKLIQKKPKKHFHIENKPKDSDLKVMRKEGEANAFYVSN
jgi:hypothetical protein